MTALGQLRIFPATQKFNRFRNENGTTPYPKSTFVNLYFSPELG